MYIHTHMCIHIYIYIYCYMYNTIHITGARARPCCRGVRLGRRLCILLLNGRLSMPRSRARRSVEAEVPRDSRFTFRNFIPHK